MKWALALTTVLSIVLPATAQEKANPFTGTSAAFEQRLRTLEEKKLDAAIANEDLAAEKAHQERLRLRAGRGAVTFEPSLVAEPAKRVPARRSAPPAPERVMPAPPPKSARLIGTVSTPAGWIALVEKGARVVNVPEGATVDGIRATAITRTSAAINGVPMTLESVIARVAGPPAAGPVAASRIAAMPIAAPMPASLPPPDAIDLGNRPGRN